MVEVRQLRQLQHLEPSHRDGKSTKSHHAAMPFAEVPALMNTLAEKGPTAALALRFLTRTIDRRWHLPHARPAGTRIY
jgi:hypothetical protein